MAQILNTPAIIVIREPERTGLPSTLTYATSGVPTPIARPASVAPIVRQVDSSARSFGSAVTADAIEP